MNTLRTLGMLTALGVLSAASTQAMAGQEAVTAQAAPPTIETPPNAASPDPNAASSPVGANERAAGKEKQMNGDTKPKDKLVGLPVESSSGQTLGSVVDIVRDKTGIPTYAVVAIDNDTTAVPYDTATAMIHNDKVVMSQAKLSAAPKVKQSEWLDQASSSWRTQSDRYWGNTRTASPGNAKKPADR